MEIFVGLYFAIGTMILLFLSIFLDTMPIIIMFVIHCILSVLMFIGGMKISKKIEQFDREAEKNQTIEEDDEYEEEDDDDENEIEPKKKSFLQTIEESKKKEKSKPRYTDKELADYGLEDWQKDLVNKGEFEPWNFEEEDLEEDDYYYDEDDK